MTPWLLEKCVKQQLDKSPVCIRSGGTYSYIIQIDSEEQNRKILNITQINYITVEIVENRFINTSKGIVYMYDYNLSNFELFKIGLQEDKTIKDVEIAKWITPHNPFSKALLKAFLQSNPPEYLDILCERAKSKIYEYHDKPMMCRKCLEYNHTMKRCTKNDTACAKCVLKVHDFKDCQSEILKCYHCGNNHKTGDRKCTIQHEQEKKMAIRSKRQVTRE